MKNKIVSRSEKTDRNINIRSNSIQSMTKTTIKVENETRKRIRILAARLDIDMDEAINLAAECLEKSLDPERR